MDDKPITRAEMVELLTQLAGDLRAEMAAVKAEMAAMKQEIIEEVQERVRDAQTEILKAFFPFQQSSDIRMRKLEANLSNTDTALTERMGVVERRLQEIERRLIINPPAA